MYELGSKGICFSIARFYYPEVVITLLAVSNEAALLCLLLNRALSNARFRHCLSLKLLKVLLYTVLRAFLGFFTRHDYYVLLLLGNREAFAAPSMQFGLIQ